MCFEGELRLINNRRTRGVSSQRTGMPYQCVLTIYWTIGDMNMKVFPSIRLQGNYSCLHRGPLFSPLQLSEQRIHVSRDSPTCSMSHIPVLYALCPGSGGLCPCVQNAYISPSRYIPLRHAPRGSNLSEKQPHEKQRGLAVRDNQLRTIRARGYCRSLMPAAISG